jgi:hypothetical protein
MPANSNAEYYYVLRMTAITGCQVGAGCLHDKGAMPRDLKIETL